MDASEILKSLEQRRQLAESIKELRRRLRIKQAELAEMLGVSRSAVAMMETRPTEVSAQLLIQAASMLLQKYEARWG